MQWLAKEPCRYPVRRLAVYGVTHIIYIAMKTIQITMDEELLSKLDADEETRADGRSAVLRRAVAEYLKRRRNRTIASAYQKAYAKNKGLSELKDWESEGIWPTE